MTTWNGSIENADGLPVKFGTARATPVTDGVTAGKDEKLLTLYLDSQNLTALASVAREDVAHLPADALITEAYIVAESAWTGTGTLTVGLAKSDSTALDADGIDATIDVDAVLVAAGDVVSCDGALVDKTETISERAWPYAVANGTVSAGTGTLYIKYIQTNAA